jgi:hypothetical protein
MRNPALSPLQALGVVHAEGADPLGASVPLAALTWTPLAAIMMAEQVTRGAVEPLLLDLAVHVRLLVAVPLLPGIHAMLASRCDEAGERLIDEGYATKQALSASLERARRWSSSPWSRAAIIAIALLMGQALFWELIADAPLQSARDERGHGPAAFWHTFVALPVFYVLVLRVLFRWLLWTATLLRVSRLPLRTSAIHPDQAGGIGFLVRPSAAFTLLVLVFSILLAASWGTEVVRFGVAIQTFGEPLTVWLLLAIALTLGPLLLFVPILVRTRHVGDREYGRLAATYGRRFAARWVEKEPSRDLLGTPDIQSLNDMIGAFDNVARTRIVPFGVADLVRIVLMVAIPMVPVVLTQLSLPQFMLKMADVVLR